MTFSIQFGPVWKLRIRTCNGGSLQFAISQVQVELNVVRLCPGVLNGKLTGNDSSQSLLVELGLVQGRDGLRPQLDLNFSRFRNGKCEWNITVERLDRSFPTSDKRLRRKLDGFRCFRHRSRLR